MNKLVYIPVRLDFYLGVIRLRALLMNTRAIATFLPFLFVGATVAQGPLVEWEKSLGGSSGDWAYSTQQTLDGGFIVAGKSNSNDGDVTGNHGSDDYWVVKLDAMGVLQWQVSLGGSSYDLAYSVQQTTDGGFIVAGHSMTNDPNFDIWVVKLSAVGNLQWQQTLSGSGASSAYSVQQTSDGGYVVAGSSVFKLNGLGVVQWEQEIGGTAKSIQQTLDGGFIVAGNRSFEVVPFGPDIDYLVVKLNSLGEVQWEQTLGGSSGDFANSIRQTSEGGYIVAGYTGSNDGDVTGNHGSSDYTDYWIVKLNSAGNLLWQKCLGGSLQDLATSVQQTSDGGFIVAGHSMSNDGDVTGHQSFFDCWVVKLSTAGSLQWQQSRGGSGTDFANSVQQTSDGGFILAGYSSSSDGDLAWNHGDFDYWVVKLSSATGVEDLPVSTISISPSPSTGVLNIQLDEPFSGSVFVFNSAGIEVRKARFNGTRASLDLSGEPTGVYLVTVRNGFEAFSTEFVLE